MMLEPVVKVVMPSFWLGVLTVIIIWAAYTLGKREGEPE